MELYLISSRDRTEIKLTEEQAMTLTVLRNFIEAGGTRFRHEVDFSGSSLLLLQAHLNGKELDKLCPLHDVASAKTLAELVSLANYLDADDIQDYLSLLGRHVIQLNDAQLISDILGLPYSKTGEMRLKHLD